MFTKRIVQILIISTLLIALLPVLQASAEKNVIGINIAESITRHDTYQPTITYTNGVVVPGTASGSGTVTLTNNAGIALYDVDLTFTPGQTSGWAYSSGTAATVTNSNPIDVKIATFPIGGQVVLTYTVGSGAVPAITLSSTYSKNVITNGAGSNTVISLSATCNGAALPSDVSSVTPVISITSADHAPIGVPDWILASASTSPGSTTTTSGSSIVWSPAAINSGTTTAPITITATVNDLTALGSGSSGAALYDIGTSSVSYSISSTVGSSSGVRLNSATGTTTEITSKMDKQFVNGKWQFTPHITTPAASTIGYDLTSISEWAVDSSALNTPLAGTSVTIGAANHDASHAAWPVLIDGATPFDATGPNEILSFAYNGVPVGFMKPVIAIRNDNTQFPKTSTSTVTANGVTLLKQIYIINGYQVEVVKTVTPLATPGQYHISIVASNLGTAATPPNVVVYDIVPSAFYSTTLPSPTNFNTAPSGTSAVTVPMSGEAYYWNIGLLGAKGSGTDTKTITYDVIGTGTYATSDLFVVGVDPAQSVNLQSTPALETTATVMNSNMEPILAMGAFCLVIIGMIGTVRRRF